MKAILRISTLVVLALALMATHLTTAQAATHSMSTKRAASYYLKIVRPLNRELSTWDDLDGLHTLPVFTREAGYVQHELVVFARKLTATNWPKKAAPKVRKLIISTLGEIDRWADVAQARSFGALHHAVARIPANGKAASAVRKALGLPKPPNL